MPRQKEFDREAALDGAMAAFWTKGYTATSIEDLVTRMGIQRGSLYATFGDKRSLFFSALSRYQRVVTRELLAALEAPGSGLAAIRRFFHLRVEGSLDRRRPPGCLVTNSAVELSRHDRGAAARVGDSLATLEAAFLRALERAHRASWPPPGTCRPSPVSSQAAPRAFRSWPRPVRSGRCSRTSSRSSWPRSRRGSRDPGGRGPGRDSNMREVVR